MIFYFLISLLISILIHEFGHLFVAKLVGCEIEEISLGLGKNLLKFKYKGIICKINLFLFGGDCQLKGERVYCLDSDSFCNLPYRKKVYIMLAGCAINLSIGCISYFLALHYFNLFLYIFGFLNLITGLFNLLPIPCLDGSGLIFIWLEKLLGKEKGYNLFVRINKTALKLWIWFNLITVPFVIYYFIMNWRKF